MKLNTCLTASLHWNIDWQSNDNVTKSGGCSYVSISLIAWIEKMDGIIRQKVKELDD